MLLIFSYITGLIYAYFWLFLIYSWFLRNWFLKEKNIPIEDVLSNNNDYELVFLITTKGGNPEVVERGINEIQKGYNAIHKECMVEVVTESEDDKKYFKKRFGDLVKVFIVPKEYETPRKTAYKARALHYMVEIHKKIFTKKESKKLYVVHYDEESIIESHNVIRLLYEVNKNPKDILAGPIFYPLEYSDSNFFSRAMEANRGFVEPECAIGMITQSPKQGHGSNLLVRMDKENQIGWDIGTDDGNPYIAEDLFFLVSASALKFSFGWHGVEMIEQPAFTIKASIKQRDRWVTGTLQTIKNLHLLDGWKKLSVFYKIQFKYGLLLRTFSYSLGFFVSIITTLYWIYSIIALLLGLVSFEANTSWTIIFFIMWVGAYQYGVYMNLRHSNKSFYFKLSEHILVFFISPLAGILETYSSCKALFRWYIFRKREQEWVPTPKVIS
jgi:hypothetical protein